MGEARRKLPRFLDALRRAGRAALIALVAGFALYSNPASSGPLLLVESIGAGIFWGAIAFAVVLTYRLLKPAQVL